MLRGGYIWEREGKRKTLKRWIWLMYSYIRMNIKTCWNHHKKETKVERRKIEGMNKWGYNIFIYGNVTLFIKQIKYHFFFTKTENKMAEQVLSGVLVPGRRWILGEGLGGWMWCKYCVHIYENGKMRPVKIISGIRGWIQLRYIVRTFANVTM
jgi:hypothetical protein